MFYYLSISIETEKSQTKSSQPRFRVQGGYHERDGGGGVRGGQIVLCLI